MLPLLPLALGATVAGVCFTVGKKLADNYIIPWTSETVEGLGKHWERTAEEHRKHQMDEIDPVEPEATSKTGEKPSLHEV